MALSTTKSLRNFTAADFSKVNGGDGTAPVPGAPRITTLMPNTAEVGAPDLTVTVSGSGFTEGTVIVGNGSDLPTTFVSKSALTAVIKPSTASGPVTIPITVRTGELTSAEAVNFTFIAPVVPEGTSEEVLAWVNNSADRATMALEAEEADSEPRSDLVSRLEAIINAEAKPKPKPRQRPAPTA